MAGDHAQGVRTSVSDLGDELAAAWRRSERRARRRRQVMAGVAASLALVVPAALAVSGLLESAPGPRGSSGASGRAVVGADIADGALRIRLTVFQRQAHTCVGLKVVSGTDFVYGATCDPAFPVVRPLAAGTLRVGSKTYVYGMTDARATTVRIGLSRPDRVAKTSPLDRAAARAAGVLDVDVRVFAARLSGSVSAPPAVEALAADGRTVSRLP